MVLRASRKANDVYRNRTGLHFSVGSIAGLFLLTGLAMTILAGMVLIPAYARLAQVRYERNCLKAANADAEALISANDRLIAAAEKDKILTQRLARSQMRMFPVNEMVVIDRDLPPVSLPGEFSIEPHPRPCPPPYWLIGASARLEKPNIRRGLFLLAVGAILAAMFMLVPHRGSRKHGRDACY